MIPALLCEVFMLNLTNSELVQLIDENIHHKRNRKILKRRLIDGVTYEALAEEFEMSVRGIKKLVYREQERLRDIAEK